MKRVAILGLDTFAAKNVSQLSYLNQHGFFFDVFTIDNRNNSQFILNQAGANNHLIIVKRGVVGVFDRILKLLSYIRKNTLSIHHFEIYPNAPFSMVYMMIAKVFNIKTIVVERGDIGEFSSQSFFSKMSMRICYKLGDIVWYKEPYMKPLLEKITNKHLSFIHNAAESQVVGENDISLRTIDFLWVNRLHPMRKAKWVIKAMKNKALQSYNCTFIGFQNNITVDEKYLPKDMLELQHYINKYKNSSITLVDYTKPEPYYRRSKFFILPAERVFGNNSLLEAMSYGLVPIVTGKNQTSMLVKNDINGIVCDDFTSESFTKAMIKGASLSDEEYSKLSNNAKLTIQDAFSNLAWSKKMLDMYGSL